MSVIISDTSCLIGLTNIGLLDILQKLYRSILITPEVAEEFGSPLPDWIQIVPVANTQKTDEFLKTLDIGESSAIALASETANSLLIIDELKGRRFASSLGIDIIGTLGLLINAYQAGFISDYSSILNNLRNSGFRIPNDAEKYFSIK
jgi:predicted nucleic acid-binding protein